MLNLLLYFIMFLGCGATVVSVIYKDTSKDSKPTKAGWILIGFAVLALVSQILLKYKEDQDNNALAQAYEEAFTGWISVGKFDETKWIPSSQDGISPYLMGLKNKTYDKKQSSEQIKAQLLARKFYMTSDDIFGHKHNPDCNKLNEWFDEKKNNINNITTTFGSRQVIKVRHIKYCEQPGQPTRFFAEVTDVRNNN